METYDVRFLQEVLDDLEEITLYIAQESHQSALQMHDRIIEKANDFSVFPKRGRFVSDKKMAAVGYRILGIKPYLVFYRIIERNVFIYRVLHGAMNYPMLYQQMVQDLGGDIYVSPC